MRLSAMLLLGLCLVACSTFAADAPTPAPRVGKLHVGWAQRNITPTQRVNLAGQFSPRITKIADSPVTLTALAIETREGDASLDQAILISCDLCLIPDAIRPKLRALLEGKLKGFDVRKIMLNATHTHSAPDVGIFKYEIPNDVMTPAQYVDFFLERVVEAAVEAWDTRKPGGMNYGLGYAVVGYNRRMTYADGTSVMYGGNNKPTFRGVEGCEDHTVETIFFFDDTKKLSGVAVNVGCPSQVVENSNYISADYWHEARKALREKYGNDLNVLGWCGAAGDQSPHPQFRKAAEARMRAAQGKTSEMRAIGLRIADAVDSAYQAIKNDVVTDLPFVHIVDDLKLPARKISENEYRSAKALCAQFKEKIDGKSNPVAANYLFWHSMVVERFEKAVEHPTYDVNLHTIVLGEVAIASNPFELYLDYGLQMKARSRAVQTFVVQLTDGYGGYLPTPRAVSGGGYSAIPESGQVGPEGGQVLVDRSVELINQSIKAKK
ncbi:MAG: hypothetical protein WCT04_25550 [Planctomycetota bacterium]